MLRLVPPGEDPRRPGRVCRHASCGGEAAWPYGFCERCEELYEEEVDRLIEEEAAIVREIDRRFPGLFVELTDEHVMMLPVYLVAHYRPGDDWTFVLRALRDCWIETSERFAQRAETGDGWK